MNNRLCPQASGEPGLLRRSLCRLTRVFLDAAGDDPQRALQKRPLQLQGLVLREGHPHLDFLARSPSATGSESRCWNRAGRSVQAPRLRRRESLEEGEVGRQQIAFDGKILAAETVEPGEAFGIQFAREDVARG